MKYFDKKKGYRMFIAVREGTDNHLVVRYPVWSSEDIETFVKEIKLNYQEQYLK